MKNLLALHILLTIGLTLLLVWWLYPLNNGAVGLIFVINAALIKLVIALITKLFFKGDKNEDSA